MKGHIVLFRKKELIRALWESKETIWERFLKEIDVIYKSK